MTLIGGAALAARAAWTLRGNTNHTDTATKAAPALYPHQWSWDAAFNAIGLACVDTARARTELDSLLRGQWQNGMIPHIVYDPDEEGYFPDAARWACAEVTPLAPRDVATSGICQPPVHAIAAHRIALGRGGSAQSARWLKEVVPKLVAWHDYLFNERRDPETGLLTLFHGWESGTDNAPRWDHPYAAVEPGADLPAYERRDTAHVEDAGQRPGDRDYDRYLWLLEEGRRSGYDPRRWRETASFKVGDVLFTAIFAAASDLLAELASQSGSSNPAVLGAQGEAARAAVLSQVDPDTGLASDVDLRAGRVLPAQTIAGFAPLVAGGAPTALRTQLRERLLGPEWAGHPDLRWAVPPSTTPGSPDFDRTNYWRGPSWPIITWLLTWALRRDGEALAADQLRQAGLEQLSDGSLSEYYDPISGARLGSPGQSWTAAVALDWTLSDHHPSTTEGT